LAVASRSAAIGVDAGTIRSPWRYEEMRSTTRVTEGAKKPPNLLRICPFRLSQK
jgi:hypothetical protein